VLDHAFVPPSRDQDWPVWWLTILVGMFLGGIFGFGTAFVMEYWNEPILTLTDVEEGIGVPLLGRVCDLTTRAR
jgi:capsular polysaccharide biosynthesis protein